MNWEFDEALDAELMMSDSATATFTFTNSPTITTVLVASPVFWQRYGQWSAYSPEDTITVIEHYQRP